MPRGVYNHKSLTQEHKAKIAVSKLGMKYKPMSEQGKANIAAGKTGVPLSEEHIISISVAHLGMKYKPMSEQGKANISAAKIGITFTTEQIANRRVAQKIALNRPEVKAANSANRKKYLKEHPEENPWYVDGSCSNGSSPDYHKNFTEEFRESIRDRDNRVCQICGKLEEKNNQALCVHHIHYDLMNDCSNTEDFISLCNSCHSATNSNREYWESKLLSKE